jgi:uncharacterized membrane protein
MKKNIEIILIVSIALNLLALGFISGNFVASRKSFSVKDHPPMNFPFKEESLIRVLPSNKQTEARNLLLKMRQFYNSSFDRNKPIFDKIEKIVVAEKFDEEEFLKKIKKLGDEMTNTKNQCDIEVAKFLATLNKEERIALFEEIKINHIPLPLNKFDPRQDEMRPKPPKFDDSFSSKQDEMRPKPSINERPAVPREENANYNEKNSE